MKDAFDEKLSQVPFPDIKGAKEVVIVGNYGGGNLGDEAMLDVLIEQIRQRDKNIRVTVPSRRPDVVARLHGQQSVAPVSLGKGVLRALVCSILMIGGGTIFSTFSGTGVVAITIVAIIRKAVLRKKVFFYGIGYSSSTSRVLSLLAKLAFHLADNVYVRDSISFSNLKQQMKIDSVSIIPELALFLRPGSIPNETKESLRGYSRPLIGFSLMYLPSHNYQPIKEAIHQFMRYLYQKYSASFCFLTFQPRIIDYSHDWKSDDEIAAGFLEGLSSEIRKSCTILPAYDHFATLAIINELDFIISMRYHCLVFGHLQRKPFVSISFEEKHRALVREYGGGSVELSQIQPSSLIAEWERINGKGDLSK